LTVASAGLAQAPAAPPADSAPSASPSAAPTAPAAPDASQAAPAGESIPLPTIGRPVPVPSHGPGSLPRDLSPWGMFLGADIVVKAIMIGLVFASLVTWTIWLAKSLELLVAKRKARAAMRVLAQARSLGEANENLRDDRDPASKLVRAAIDELRTSEHSSAESLKERISWLLGRLEMAASRRVGRGMGVLATIGATSPFVGLFGTVWGIMNSFIGISNAHTTNLAVVAPGIAEALLATALGLFAAIPAVVIYNVFSRSIGGYRALLADAGALVMRLVSRDCDRAERLPVSMSRAAE
jgi:biopolymer transport protein ExbB